MVKDLNIDYDEMFLNTLRENLFRLKNARKKALSIAEKERKHRESYEKFPQTLEEVEEWEEVQDRGDE